ncbi:MAG TPA: putative O-glycosylation ligase, exosortase A system-associated [Acidobacteriota bacterium]|nr:putative O-glycosylation ligase, exosortase A system-associated [Acidobacteriota bacterium]
MRDLLVALVVFGSLPFSLFRPHYGIMLYAWIGLMNPHRLSWRMADAPVGLAAALATMLGTVFTGQVRSIPFRSTTWLLILFAAYTTFTTYTALSGADAWVEWNRFVRILAMCLVAMMLLQERKRLEMFLFVCMASIAFFGVKGGFFSLATAGQYRVWGPVGTFIEGNNELALAELMILPLLLYFAHRARVGWKRLALWVAIFLTMLSILFSYSRGAFIGFAGLAIVMIMRSRYRIPAILMAVLLVVLILALAPTEWTARMFSIGEYEQDESAMGRINAWTFAYNLATDRIFGGGFRTFTKEWFMVYAPDPLDVHDAHSIYFEVLGEQGFPGLFIFLAILGTTLWRLERLRRRGAGAAERVWYSDLAEMLQFSLIAYGLGGAFLGLAYFDLPYYLIVGSIMLEFVVEREEAERLHAEAEPRAGTDGSLAPAGSTPIAPGGG